MPIGCFHGLFIEVYQISNIKRLMYLCIEWAGDGFGLNVDYL